MEAGGIEFRIRLFRKSFVHNGLDHNCRQMQSLRKDRTRPLLTVEAVRRPHLLGTDWVQVLVPIFDAARRPP